MDGIYTIINAYRWLLSDKVIFRSTWVKLFKRLHHRAVTELNWPQWGEQLRPFDDFHQLAQLACSILNESEVHYPSPPQLECSRHPFDLETIRNATNEQSDTNCVFIVGIQLNDITTALPFTVTGATKTKLKLFDVSGMKRLELHNQKMDDMLLVTANTD